jgi:hypothetical protein
MYPLCVDESGTLYGYMSPEIELELRLHHPLRLLILLRWEELRSEDHVHVHVHGFSVHEERKKNMCLCGLASIYPHISPYTNLTGDVKNFFWFSGSSFL